MLNGIVGTSIIRAVSWLFQYYFEVSQNFNYIGWLIKQINLIFRFKNYFILLWFLKFLSGYT